MGVNLKGYLQIFSVIILYYTLQIWRKCNNYWIVTGNQDTEEEYTAAVSVNNMTQIHSQTTS